MNEDEKVWLTRIEGKIDVINTKLEPLEEHRKEGDKPGGFRDKLTSVYARVGILQSLVLLTLTGMVYGFWYLWRTR